MRFLQKLRSRPGCRLAPHLRWPGRRTISVPHVEEQVEYTGSLAKRQKIYVGTLSDGRKILHLGLGMVLEAGTD
jgi:hypothetical protein